MRSGLICVDYSRNILMINRTAKNILGLNPDDDAIDKIGGILFEELNSMTDIPLFSAREASEATILVLPVPMFGRL